jgi:hypothetical protein
MLSILYTLRKSIAGRKILKTSLFAIFEKLSFISPSFFKTYPITTVRTIGAIAFIEKISESIIIL